MQSLFIHNLLWSVFLFFCFYLGIEEKLVKRFNVSIIGYIALMISIVSYTVIILPQYTYEEAKKLVESETGKQVVDPLKGEVKAQLELYFIYTTNEVYIFNAESGSYGARTPIKNN